MKDLIKKLSEAFGPSGNEDEVRDIIKKEVKPYTESVKVDKLGNLIVRKKGKGKKLMFAAHMDEIGFIVSYIDKKGFLRFSNVGGLFPINLLHQRVMFKNGLVGVVGEEKRKDLKAVSPLDKLYIDIGAKSKEDAEKKVGMGEMAVFSREFRDLGDRVVGKAMDDRIGCVVLIEALKRIKNPVNDLYFVFTVQEEVGLRGARTSAFGIEPDYAIAVDVTGTGDTPEGWKSPLALGNGVAIKVKDRGMIASAYVRDRLVSIAKKKKIPYQLEVLEGGTTDGMVIEITKSGVPTGVLSVPTRYIHSPSELLDMGDVEATVKLLVEFSKERFN